MGPLRWPVPRMELPISDDPNEGLDLHMDVAIKQSQTCGSSKCAYT